MNRVNVHWEQEPPPLWSVRVAPFLTWVLNRLQASCWQVNVFFVSRDTCKEYNKKFRGKDYPTDILSFADQPLHPLSHTAGGDLLVCLDLIAENAKEFSVDFGEEVNRTLIHGVLHLMGWEHDEKNPTGPMIDLQERLLTEAFTQEEYIYVAVA